MQNTNLFGNQLVNQSRSFGTTPISVGFQGNQGSTFQQMGFSQSQTQPSILGFSTGLQSGLGGMGGGINNMQGQQFMGGISAGMNTGIQQPGMQVMGSGLQAGQIQNSILGQPILNQGMQQNIVSSQGLIQNQMGQRISQGFLTQPQSTGFLNQPAGTSFLNQPGSTGLLNQPLNSGFLNQPASTGFLNQPVSTGLLNQPVSSGFLNQTSNQGFLNQGISQGMNIGISQGVGFGLNQGLNQGNLLGNNQMTNFQNQNQYLTSMPLSTSLGMQRPLTTQMTQQPGLLQQNNNMLATFGQDNFRKTLTQSPIQVNQKEGTSWLKFNITRDRDGQNISTFANFMTITAMEQYSQKSLEELRLEDFRLKRQGINGMQQQGINQFNGMQNMQGGLTGLQQNSLLTLGMQNNTPGTQMGISSGIPNNQLFAQNNLLSFSQGQVATSGSLFSQNQQANNQNWLQNSIPQMNKQNPSLFSGGPMSQSQSPILPQQHTHLFQNNNQSSLFSNSSQVSTQQNQQSLFNTQSSQQSSLFSKPSQNNSLFSGQAQLGNNQTLFSKPTAAPQTSLIQNNQSSLFSQSSLQSMNNQMPNRQYPVGMQNQQQSLINPLSSQLYSIDPLKQQQQLMNNQQLLLQQQAMLQDYVNQGILLQEEMFLDQLDQNQGYAFKGQGNTQSSSYISKSQEFVNPNDPIY